MLDSDLKPVLVDFGKAMKLRNNDDDITNSIEGTYLFLPPECCQIEHNERISMKKADVWALGITAYIMVFNKFPF